MFVRPAVARPVERGVSRHYLRDSAELTRLATHRYIRALYDLKECFMSLEPLLNASAAVRLHTFPAIAAFALGAIQLAAPKGTLPHRALGWIWVVLMSLVALSSFFIHTICTVGPFSVIHLLSIVTLVALPLGVWRARRREIGAHRRTMQLLFLGALLVAGIFTFMPGRIMHDVAFDTRSTHGSCR